MIKLSQNIRKLVVMNVKAHNFMIESAWKNPEL